MDLAHPPSDPYPLFRAWYDDAERSAEIKYAHAVCLATVDPEGLPDARTVLLEHLDDGGFVFFTDERSPKARDLACTPEAALVFYWGPLDRQVRVRGPVEEAADEIADACFEKRPHPSRAVAWASLQSRTLASRRELEERLEQVAEKFAGVEALPRPPHWRAYRLRPRTVELWQARARRLHERLLYTRTPDGGWRTTWLYP